MNLFFWVIVLITVVLAEFTASTIEFYKGN